MQDPKTTLPRDDPDHRDDRDDRDDRDEVLEAALDSFPASDPPGWGGVRLGPPASHSDHDRDEIRAGRRVPIQTVDPPTELAP